VLEGIDDTNPAARADIWERVIAKLRAKSMPPAGRPRPDAATYHAIATSLEAAIDRAWAAHPNPGRIGAVPSPQSRRIQQRDPRPLRARYRCDNEVAGRRNGGRQLR
jgi:hypothetical protein